MAAKPLPPSDVLHQLLDFDAVTGRLRWRVRDVVWFTASQTRTAEHIAALWNKRYAGTLALDGVSHQGYREGHLLGISFKAHRVIWKMLNGTEPEQIDHEDGNRANNRESNLVAATNATNTKNAKMRSDNSTGVVGVYFYPYQKRNKRRWQAQVGGKHLGIFDSFDDAVAARRAAEVKYGYHPNHGRD